MKLLILLSLIIYGQFAFGSPSEILDCRGKTSFKRFDVRASCSEFTNSSSSTIYLYEVKIDPELFTYNRGKAILITGKYIKIPSGSSKYLATDYTANGSSFGINVLYVAVTMGGEYRWLGNEQVCINMNLSKNAINPSQEKEYYSKEVTCDRDDVQLAFSEGKDFKNSERKVFKSYKKVTGGKKTDSRIQKYLDLQSKTQEKIDERTEKLAACERVQDELDKDIAVIDYSESFKADVQLCSTKLLKALEDAEINSNKLDQLVSEFKRSLIEDHTPEVKERLDMLKIDDYSDRLKSLDLIPIYKGNSFDTLDRDSPSFYISTAQTCVDSYLDRFVSALDEESFRVAELAFSETFSFYPDSFTPQTTSNSKFDYLNGISSVKAYLSSIGKIGTVDEYGYDQDSPVPTEIKKVVKEEILAVDEFRASGVRLEERLQALRGSLSEEQKRSFLVIQAFAYLITNAYEDSIKIAPRINSALKGIAESLTGALCESTMFTPFVNDGRDAYEAISGFDACSGEKLSVTSRLLSAAGVFVGSGSLFRKLGNSKLPITNIDDLGFESAKNIRSKISNLGDVIPGTTIPKYFRLKTDRAEFFVNPNATKHIGEYINSLPTSHGFPLRNDLILASLESAVTDAVKSGTWKTSLDTGNPILSGGWELIFSKRPSDELVVIKHALMKK